MPSVMSKLPSILRDANHAVHVKLSDDELRRLYLWLDGNAAFYGAYSEEERMAQRNGEAIPVPALE